METYIPVLIGLTGLVASLMAGNLRAQQFLFALTGIGILWTARPGFDPADNAAFVLCMLSLPVVIGLLAGMIVKKYGEWIALAGTLVTLALLSKTITYFEFEVAFNPKIALLPFFGGLIPLISKLKGKLVSKWFGFASDADAISGGVSVFFGGLLVFFATFQAQYFGVLLLGAGWLAVALTQKNTALIASGIAMLSLGFVFVVMKTNPTADDSFLRGNFLMGLVIGAAALSWTGIAKNLHKFTWIFTFILPVLIAFAAIMLGKVNPNFGGIPTYVGALLGSAIVLFTRKNAAQAVPFQALLIGLSAFILTQFAPVELPEKKSRLAGKEETTTTAATPEAKPDPMEVTAIALKSDQEGTWKSEIEGSTLSFKLGPEGGVTTGIFDKFDVTLKLDANGEPVKIDLKMPSTALNTFDDGRDEHLHSADFLNTAKFPDMKYASKSIKKENDRYFVTGEFTMMGVKQPVNLEIKFAANGMEKGKQYLVMIGKSSLDRTKFGMQPDASLGNVVDVNFEIEFRK